MTHTTMTTEPASMINKVFKAYDVRATYPKPLNEEMAWQIGFGTARFLLETAAAEGTSSNGAMMKTIVVGRDMRKHSPALAEALMKGMCDFGANVIDVGMVDTPFVYFAINHLGCCGGVQTTASHNPAEYNGFKISKTMAKPVGMATGLDKIREYASAAKKGTGAGGGKIEKRDLWEAYRGHVLKFLHADLLSGKNTVKVAIDASNGMAGTMVPKVFGDVKGLKITKINFDNSTGEFVHEPNPLVEANLTQVKDTVKKDHADLGICFDGDADRCMAVDEKGESVPCDHLTAWLCRGFLKSNPGSAIVYDLRSTKALAEIISETGGRPVKSRVGHVFMKQALADQKAVFGGELSGHFYFRDNFNADSGAIAFAALLTALVESGGAMSAQIEPAKRYVQSGEINFETEDKDRALASLKGAYPAAKFETLDGLTVDCGDWWCNVRASNTEPLLRLNLEAKDRASVDRLVADVSKHLGKRVAH
ncbi:MAG TPA: phosphomannomutase/phosphoglucomutase [Phycisphaerales bacterium]|nr:phosphomannomutase/phosphoglucomutase [Phycisphaerales bacterium]